MTSLKGKVAIVTGGTQGLGVAIANVLAERGVTGIVTCGRNSEKGVARAKEIASATGADVRFVPADLGVVEECRRVVSEADRLFGRVDILVNAAGNTNRGTILDTDPALFDLLFAVNVRAPFFLMQEVIKVMRRERIEGAIVNISSMSSMGGQPFIAPYCASKGALDTLTRNTAYALLRNRIRVNSLNIGWMASDGEDQTQRAFHGSADDWLERASAAQPNGRLIDPNEVARAVAFLASSESGLMTGAIINYDQAIWGAYDTSPHPQTPL